MGGYQINLTFKLGDVADTELQFHRIQACLAQSVLVPTREYSDGLGWVQLIVTLKLGDMPDTELHLPCLQACLAKSVQDQTVVCRLVWEGSQICVKKD
jgi:hypothetical protein